MAREGLLAVDRGLEVRAGVEELRDAASQEGPVKDNLPLQAALHQP